MAPAAGRSTVNGPFVLDTVPPNASMTCPNGNTTTCGAGDSAQSLANWRSAIAMANNSVPGWYQFDATYDKAAASGAICNGATQIWVW